MYIFSDVNPARANKNLILTRSKELVARAFGYNNWYELKVATQEQVESQQEPLSAHDYEHAVDDCEILGTSPECNVLGRD